MRYVLYKIGGETEADTVLMNFLNALPADHRVVAIIPGRYGRWHGLDEEYGHGHKIIVDTNPSENIIP